MPREAARPVGHGFITMSTMLSHHKNGDKAKAVGGQPHSDGCYPTGPAARALLLGLRVGSISGGSLGQPDCITLQCWKGLSIACGGVTSSCDHVDLVI